MSDTSNPGLAKAVLDEASRQGFPLAADQVERIVDYLGLVAKWNGRIRLVGSAGPDSLVGVHLADAIAFAKAIGEHPTSKGPTLHVLDVGSGAGLPGFALGLLVPRAEISLCEISSKRVSFLHEAKRRVGLGVEILEMRAQDLLSKGRRFPHVVSRATFPPLEWRRVGEPLCVPEGLHWSMWTAEQELPFAMEELFRYRYQLGDGRRRVIAARQVP